MHPEFVMVSWYKLFGYPTGVGSLVARRDALARLRRPWFSGGTIQAVSVGMPWHAMAPDEMAFEDGTLNFLSISDIHIGLDWLAGIGVPLIGARVRMLTDRFLNRLVALRHSDGTPMARVYGPTDTADRGGTVAFNFVRPPVHCGRRGPVPGLRRTDLPRQGRGHGRPATPRSALGV